MLAAEWPSALYSSSRVPSFLHRGVVPSRLFFRGFPATHRPNFRVSGRQPPREKEAEDLGRTCWSSAAWCSASSTTRGTGDFFFTFFLSFLLYRILFKFKIKFYLCDFVIECCYIYVRIIEYTRSAKSLIVIYLSCSTNFRIFCFSFSLFLRLLYIYIFYYYYYFSSATMIKLLGIIYCVSRRF